MSPLLGVLQILPSIYFVIPELLTAWITLRHSPLASTERKEITHLAAHSA